MAQIVTLLLHETGQSLLWTEEWQTLRTVSRTTAVRATPAQHNVTVSAGLLERLHRASCIMDAAKILKNASTAQSSRRCFLEFFFHISHKLAGQRWSEVRAILEERAQLYLPTLESGRPRYRRFNHGRRAFILIQEQVTYALGIIPPLAMPIRMAAMGFRQTIGERATIYANFIRKGATMLERAHTDVAWAAVTVAILEVTKHRLDFGAAIANAPQSQQ